MTATDTLRAMLDERGVEWESTGWPAEHQTFYEAGGVGFIAIGLDDELGDSRMRVCFEDYMTPAQAIAATLGAGTCHNVCNFEPVRGECEADETETIYCVGDSVLLDSRLLQVHVMECTECGHTYEHVNGDYEYCPRCGRKRKDFVE